MCGRVLADLTPAHWALLGVGAPSLPARYNATRGATLGLLRQEDGGRVVTPASWGLVPEGLTKAEANRLALFNARIETVQTKPAFRQAWTTRRALLPVTAWLEWLPGLNGGKKRPFLIRRMDGLPVVLAALFTPHEGQLTFAVVTGPAAPELDWLHQRMPLAVPSKDWAAWLDPTQPPVLNPLPGRVYEVLPLDSAVNDARLDHPGVVQVIGEPVRGAA